MPPTDYGNGPSIAAGLDRPRGAVPDDPRPQVGELVAGVVAGEHAQRRLERIAAQLGEVLGAADQAYSSSTGHFRSAAAATSCCASTSSGLRGMTVGSISPSMHLARDDGALEQIAAVLGEDDALRWLADLVTRPADSLQSAGDRSGRLDLDDEVHGAHVDAQLERCTWPPARAAGRP